MVIWVLRALFILVSGSIGYNVARTCQFEDVLTGILLGIVAAVVVIALEAVFSKRPISSISAILFGLLIGFVMARFFTEAVFLVLGPNAHELLGHEIKRVVTESGEVVIQQGAPLVSAEDFHSAISLIMTGFFCYLGISIIYQTRDRFRFIIPYVEFRAMEQGPKPFVLDTSAIVDGRVADLVDAHFIQGQILTPRFVLAELQGLADSNDRVRRERGRRGLDVLERLRSHPGVEMIVREVYEGSDKPVDEQLIDFAKSVDGRILTTDFSLYRVAQIQGVDVLNLNDVAKALKPMALPGEELEIEVVKAGEGPDQGIGYLPDGAMVVVERGRGRIGQKVKVEVARIHETAAGHMVFARLKE